MLSRFVYNYGLSIVKIAFNGKKAIPTYEEIANLLPLLKIAEETKFLADAPAQCLQQALKEYVSCCNLFF